MDSNSNTIEKGYDMKYLVHWLNIDTHPHTYKDIAISSFGAIFGIFVTYYGTKLFLGEQIAFLITASMGASAVLLFAVPHGVLSGPWSVIGGHTISALIGVFVAQHIADPIVASSVGVGSAVLAMQTLRCVHPPGGATALIAVIGGSAVHDLGYGFVLFPVVINALMITVSAVAYNSFFPWRRYPPVFIRPSKPSVSNAISAVDIENAIRELDIYVDISSDELLEIYDHAIQNRR